MNTMIWSYTFSISYERYCLSGMSEWVAKYKPQADKRYRSRCEESLRLYRTSIPIIFALDFTAEEWYKAAEFGMTFNQEPKYLEA